MESQVKSSFLIGNLDNDEDEGGVGGGDEGVTVIDVVDNHNLQEINLDKKAWMGYVKDYVKKVKAKLEEQGKTERIPEFQKGATQLVKHLAEKFDEVQIFTGSNFDMEGSYAYCYQVNQEDAGPTFFFFLDAMKEEKYWIVATFLAISY